VIVSPGALNDAPSGVYLTCDSMRHGDLSEILSAYATHLSETRGYAEGTRKAYLGAARQLVELIQVRPEAILITQGAGWEAVDKRALEIFLNHLRDSRAWSPATLAAHLRALRALFGWLKMTGRVARDPTQGLRISAERRGTSPPEGDEARIRTLLGALEAGLAGARLGLLVELTYGAGMRPVHVYDVREMRCWREEGRISVRTGQGEVELLLTPAGIARAETYLALRQAALQRKGRGGGKAEIETPEEAPFWVGARGRGLGGAALGKQLRAAMRRAGLSGGAADLRRLAARHFRERGADLRSVQKFLGTRRLGALQHYGSADFRGVSASLRHIHPRHGQD
jgi:site-specific recombinase XerC